MTDPRTLLHDAAPDPVRPLDLAELHRRADQRGVRRIVAWIAGMGVLLASLPVGNSLLVQGAGDGEEAGPPPAEAPDDRDSTETADHDPASPRPSGRPSGESPAGESSTTTSTVFDDGDPDTIHGFTPEGDAWVLVIDRAAPTTAPPAETTHPEKASCAVTTEGLANGQQRSCHFTATAAGGAAMSGDTFRGWEEDAVGDVTVTRDGQVVYRWNSDEDGFGAFVGNAGVHQRLCPEPDNRADRLFIEPGDIVDVVVTLVRDEGSVVTLGAGEGWTCDSPRPTG